MIQIRLSASAIIRAFLYQLPRVYPYGYEDFVNDGFESIAFGVSAIVDADKNDWQHDLHENCGKKVVLLTKDHFIRIQCWS